MGSIKFIVSEKNIFIQNLSWTYVNVNQLPYNHGNKLAHTNTLKFYNVLWWIGGENWWLQFVQSRTVEIQRNEHTNLPNSTITWFSCLIASYYIVCYNSLIKQVVFNVIFICPDIAIIGRRKEYSSDVAIIGRSKEYSSAVG